VTAILGPCRSSSEAIAQQSLREEFRYSAAARAVDMLDLIC